jgi:pentalenene oxygenase
VEIRIGPRPAFAVCRPDLAPEVPTNLRTFDRDGVLYAASRTALGDGLDT